MTSKHCRHVKLTRWGKVHPCQGRTYSGKHFHDYPQLSPPRDPVEGDINVDTGQPVQFGQTS